MYQWGIDLGGTKIECAVMEKGREHKLVARKRIPTEADKGYEHILQQIKKLITEVQEEYGIRPERIGFATPGVSEPDTGLMKNCNTTSLNGKPLKKDLENLLGVPVRLANDANCFALAETLMGAGMDYPEALVVFGIIMGTGVGGGLVVNRQIIGGRHGIAGEWGHNILEENGSDCYCGKKGCVEKVISGPALESFYAEVSGTKKALRDIVQAHQEGSDAFATQTIQRLMKFYGRAVATLINVIDPDLIIIGGGVGNIDLLYTEGYEQIRNYIFNQRKVTTPVVKPVLGDSAGVFGAVLLWEE